MDVAEDAEVRIERLAATDAAVLPDAIRGAYGDSYDHAWAYDTDAVAGRLADGSLVSFVGRADGGPDDGRVVGRGARLKAFDEGTLRSGGLVPTIVECAALQSHARVSPDYPPLLGHFAAELNRFHSAD